MTERSSSSPKERGPWQPATVVAIRPETATAKTIRLRLPRPSGHLAGQHYVVRLTVPDGYSTSRSFSVASAPDGSSEMEMTVERLPDGEVSTFLTDQLRPGDELDVRGPIGGWFVWPGDIPALLVGGGSGVVPLTAMLRLARRNGTPNLVRMVVSVRSPDDLYYTDELPGPETTIVYTRHAPASEARRPGRSTARDLPRPPAGGLTFICGSSSFADAAGDLVVGSGTSIPDIRIERLAIGWPLPLTGWARRDFESPVRPGTFDGMNRRGSVTTGTGPPPPVRPALPLLVRRRRCRVGED